MKLDDLDVLTWDLIYLVLTVVLVASSVGLVRLFARLEKS
jgi:hypothetical protein